MNYELYHHGIKGMKWGIRRFQKKNGSLTAEGKARYDHDKVIIKKGASVQRVSKTNKETGTGRTYISFKELDNLKYVAEAGHDGLYWTSNADNYGYKVKLKVTEDIIAPSYKETIDAFVASTKDVPVKTLAENIYGRKEDKTTSYAKKEWKKNTKEFVNNMKHLGVDEARQNAYLAYSRSLMDSKSTQKAFFDELEKRGYNAVVDHNDAQSKDGSKGYYDTPLIVFERSRNLKQTSAKPITQLDQDAALDRIYKEERKGG